MTFWQVVAVIRARIRVVIGLVAVTLLCITLAAPKPKVTYEAVCYVVPTLQAMQGGISMANDSAQNVQSRPDRNIILSNLLLLAGSGEVYQRALDFLALPVEKQREAMPGLPGYKQISRPMYSPDKAVDPKDWKDVLRCTPAMNSTIGNDVVTSDVIRLRVKMPNGADVTYLANAVGYAFSEVYRTKSHEEMRNYIDFLQSGTEDAHKTLLDVETRMAEYQKMHGVTGADAETQNAVMALAALEVQRNSDQAEASAARSALDDSYRQLAEQPLVRTDSLPADLNPRVVKLKEELDSAEAELRQLATKYKPGHAMYQAQEAHIEFLREQIAREGSTYAKPAINDLHDQLLRQLSQLANTYASTSARLSALDAQVANAQAKLANLAGTQKEIVDLTRDHQKAKDEYNLFVGRLAQARIADMEFQKYGSILPFDWARAPAGPIVDGPRKRVLLLYGFILSLAFALGLCIWLESIDNRVRNVKDVEQLLGLPSVGVIPEIEGRNELPKLTHLFPLSPAAESYRMLRTNILFAQQDNPFKTLMAATGRPGQGATTTICNLAIALAQAGQKIILIDADLRRPALHEFFGLSNEKGLSTLLRTNVNPLSCMQKTEIPNLIIIPAGPPPLNPSELLASSRMQEIVERLKEHSDMVLFDTPSIVVFSDGAVLANWLDAVVFVMSADQIPRGSEHEALELLRRAKANILGVVVNRMSPDDVDNCHFYAEYYPTPDMEADIYSISSGQKATGGELAPAEKPAHDGAPVWDDLAGPPTQALASPPEQPVTVTDDGNQTEDDNPFPKTG